MTCYIVVNHNGNFVCGPFTSEKDAKRWADVYSGSPFWGECHVEIYEDEE